MAARHQTKAAMVPNRPRWLLAAAWLLAASVSPAAAASACGDLLSGLAPRPAFIDFLGCRYHPEAQTRPRVARYRVRGRHARAAEAYLQHNFHIRPLAWYCCQWESTDNFHRATRTGRTYIISMNSGETIFRDRRNWANIAYFHLDVAEETMPP